MLNEGSSESLQFFTRKGESDEEIRKTQRLLLLAAAFGAIFAGADWLAWTISAVITTGTLGALAFVAIEYVKDLRWRRSLRR